jgi:AraC-like DNA-binding protein
MNYCEHQPHPHLSQSIECYWTMQGASHGSTTVFPDGCMDLIYTFESVGCQLYVVGNMTKPIRTSSDDKADFLGVRFHPGGLAHFTKANFSELTDLVVDANEILKVPSWCSVDALTGLKNENRISTLNKFFLSQLNREPRQAWENCLHEMMQTKGAGRINQLSFSNGISEKHLHRKFIEKVGLSPKQLARILRFREAKNKIENQGFVSLGDLAFTLGYNDHAHLTKSFKELAGITPSEFSRMHV